MKLFSKEDLQIFAKKEIHKIVPGYPLLLFGPLGVGKSTLGRFFIQEFLENKEYPIPSPSFPIMLPYERQKPLKNKENKEFSYIWHMDLYRLNTEEEIVTLDIPFFIENYPVVLEWPERLGSLMPINFYHIELQFSSETDKRLLLIK